MTESPRPTSVNQVRKSSRSQNTVCLTTLLVALVITRWWSHAHIVLHDDSINFIRALSVFDLSTNSPHPPGYILFVLLGRLMHLVVPEGISAYFAVNVLMQGIVVIAVFAIVGELLDRWSGFAAAAVVVLHPLFWYYGSVALAYTADAAAFVLVGWMLHRHAKEPSTATAVALGVIWGLVGGIRQFAMVFTAPVVLWQLYVNRQRASVWPALFATTVGVSAWMIPLVVMSGGWSQYQSASTESLGYYLRTRSPLFAENSNWVFYNVARWAMGMSQVLWPLLPFLALKWVSPKSPREETRNATLNSAWRWMLLVAPATVFCLVVYIGQSGYLLALLGPAIIMAAVVAARKGRATAFRACACVAAVIGGLFFVFAPPSDTRVLSARPAAYYLSPANLDEVAARAYRYQADYTLNGIRKTEGVTAGYVTALEQFDPDSTLVMFAHERELVRSVLSYHAPSYSIVGRNWQSGQWECEGQLCSSVQFTRTDRDGVPDTLDVHGPVTILAVIDDKPDLDPLRETNSSSGKWNKGLIVLTIDTARTVSGVVCRRSASR